jgi:hypothetical protein
MAVARTHQRAGGELVRRPMTAPVRALLQLIDHGVAQGALSLPHLRHLNFTPMLLVTAGVNSCKKGVYILSCPFISSSETFLLRQHGCRRFNWFYYIIL